MTEQKVKTKILNNVEYEIETHDFNKKLSNIKIPKGWRLWKASDFEKMDMADFKNLNLKGAWFYIEQPLGFQKDKCVARFGAGSVRASLSCGRDPSGVDSLLGVRFARDVKE